MQKLLVTLTVCAAVVTGLVTSAPKASASTPPIPQFQMPEAQVNPEGLKLREIPKLHLLNPHFFKAELTCQLFIQPTNHWAYKKVILNVRNTGLKNSGVFHDYLKIVRPGIGTVAGYIANPSLAPGGQVWYAFYVYAPHGISFAGAKCDAFAAVPEYNELNNVDTIP